MRKNKAKAIILILNLLKNCKIVILLKDEHNLNYYIGQAIDIHNLIKKKSIISLGGYQFQNEYKIIADSDGDVVLHAIANSILGALGKGDIGKYFKKSDFEKERSSIKIIRFALSELSKEKKSNSKH